MKDQTIKPEIVSIFGWKCVKNHETVKSTSCEHFKDDVVTFRSELIDGCTISISIKTSHYGVTSDQFIREFNKLVLGI